MQVADTEKRMSKCTLNLIKMKLISKLSALMLFFVLACSKENLPVNEPVNDNNPFVFQTVDGNLYKAKLFEWNVKNLGTMLPVKSTNDETIAFNYDNLTIASMQGDVGHVIVANEVNLDPNDNTKFGIGYFEYNNEIVGALEVQLDKLSETEFEISYYSLEDDDMITLHVNTEDNTVTAYGNNSALMKSTFEINGWGRNTMNCLADVYSNHGLISVWAFVQTAYLPATAAALAVACGIRNL
jgi:hypothetical protein